MTTKKAALGRGFEGLIPTGFDVTQVAAPGEQIRQIPLHKLHPNPEQPRKSFDEVALAELASSIKEHGIIQPLVVTPDGESFRIVAGERRYRAAQKAGLKTLPAIVRNHKELEELEIALVENVQRVDLSPLEQAVSIVRLRDQFSLTSKQIAKKLGKAETTISNIVRLLQLPPEAVEAMQKNQISEGHARAILALKTDEKAQKELLNKIITQKLSVREAEQFVHAHKPSKAGIAANDLATQKLRETIKGTWKGRVLIKQRGSEKGQLTISYKTRDELQKLISLLNKN